MGQITISIKFMLAMKDFPAFYLMNKKELSEYLSEDVEKYISKFEEFLENNPSSYYQKDLDDLKKVWYS